MQEIQDRLIRQAMETHQNIAPCSNRESLHDCFSTFDDKLIFWFNTDDDSTHVIMEEVRNSGQ